MSSIPVVILYIGCEGCFSCTFHPPDDMMEDKKALVVSGLKIVLYEQSLRVCR